VLNAPRSPTKEIRTATIVRATVLPREEQLGAYEDIEFDEEGDEEYNDDEEEKEDIDAGRGDPSRRLPVLRKQPSHHLYRSHMRWVGHLARRHTCRSTHLSPIFLQPTNGGFRASGGLHWHVCGFRSPIRVHGLHRGGSFLFSRFLRP